MVSSSSSDNAIELAKKKAAITCAQKYIQNGCRLGVGSGSTVTYLIEYLGEKCAEGTLNDIVCIPSSLKTKQQLIEKHIPITDLDSTPEIDVCIDGADEVDSQFNCIKGRGGCLAQEKIVQTAAKYFYIIADYLKESSRLGQRCDTIPIEVLPFASRPLLLSIPCKFGGSAEIRQAMKKCGPILTDNGNYIIDWNFEKNLGDQNWENIHSHLVQMPGIVETGLFFNVVNSAFIAYPDGTVKELINASKN